MSQDFGGSTPLVAALTRVVRIESERNLRLKTKLKIVLWLSDMTKIGDRELVVDYLLIRCKSSNPSIPIIQLRQHNGNAGD